VVEAVSVVEAAEAAAEEEEEEEAAEEEAAAVEAAAAGVEAGVEEATKAEAKTSAADDAAGSTPDHRCRPRSAAPCPSLPEQPDRHRLRPLEPRSTSRASDSPGTAPWD
jgi:hypothetical protein